VTVTVTGVVRNVSGNPDRSKWVFTSLLRESGDVDNSIVSPGLQVVTPNAAGLLTVELDPGPVIVRYGNTAVTVTVPDVDELDLWRDLLAVAVNIPPGTPDQKLAAAIAAYFEAHPGEGGGSGGDIDGGTPSGTGSGSDIDGGTP
jgi:hypothetical protein